MARRGKRGKRENGKTQEDWKQILPVAGLLAAVLITLLLGAVLRTDPLAPQAGTGLPSTSSPPPAAPVEPPVAAPSEAVQPRTETPPADLALDLAQRARIDARRIRSTSADWTLQFMLACDPGNIRSRVEELAGQSDFFLLPKLHDGRSCFRLCWGRFRSREQALATTSYPRALQEITGKPQALEIARTTP